MSQNVTFARPYAKAVFELAQKEKDFAKWSDMLMLASTIAQDPRVAACMKNPKFSRTDVFDLFLAIGKENFSTQMQGFLHLLGSFKRLSLLPSIAELYEQMRAQAEKLITIEFVSAYPIEEPERQRFIDILQKRMNRNVTLECITDKNILGGAIIRAGDLVIDGSIRGRLAKLGDAVGLS